MAKSMDEVRGIVEFVCEGGIGGSAKVCAELRTGFPGIGGPVITRESMACALREEFNPSPQSAPGSF